MNDTVLQAHMVRGLPWWRIGLVACLGLVGLSYAGWIVLHSREPDRDAGSRDVAQQAKDYLREQKFEPLSAPLAELIAHPKEFLVKTQGHPLLGEKAPPLELSDHRERPWQLAHQLEKGPVVLVFYYGYFCNHCVAQLFALHADIALFHELGAEVVAISPDSPQTTRERFRKYGEFSFPVLADPDHKIAQQYGVFTKGKDGQPDDLEHATFVIGRDGTVAWTQHGDTPFTGNRTLLYELARVEGRLAPSSEP